MSEFMFTNDYFAGVQDKTKLRLFRLYVKPAG